MQTWELHIQGIVQGVGFRPFVYRVAASMAVNGYVSNEINGVLVVFNANEAHAKFFEQRIRKEAPGRAVITSTDLREVFPHQFSKFRIEESSASKATGPMLTPDLAICPQCIQEVNAPANRRHGYPFTTCTICGPRYSVINAVPYDRANTNVDRFAMCNLCLGEYTDPSDRRHHSQTNSCAECGITLQLSSAADASSAEIIERVCASWEAGLIVAIKGIGGYLLTCDARNSEAIKTLRARKRRSSKPFAVMYPSLEKVKSEFRMMDVELSAVGDAVAPIVLLSKAAHNVLPKVVAPGIDRIGVMVPYTPLYHLLLEKYQAPIIATSANISNTPIIFRDSETSHLEYLADDILHHDLPISTPQDDSVVRFSPLIGIRILLRRSRGLAPTLMHFSAEAPSEPVLATGAMLKSTFSIQDNGKIYTSQYLGDLQAFDTELNYKQALEQLMQILEHRPAKILCDLHPGYPSSRIAKEMAKHYGTPLIQIQHHEAHFAAILSEHELMRKSVPILGVIWDGLGLGHDGKIWGGEFLVYENPTFKRMCHFDYFPYILGDKMAREPRISLLAILHDVEAAQDLLHGKFDARALHLYRKRLSKRDVLKTSSVGRIFDAVASLLGIMDKQSFEGEAALRLESLAQACLSDRGLEGYKSYLNHDAKSTISAKLMLTHILEDMASGVSPGVIAANFHYTLVEIVEHVARLVDVETICFSGGVFQNAVLLEMMQHHLHGAYKVCFHCELAPNDENISLGQLMHYQISKRDLGE